MDWNLAIEKNRDALKRIVATLVAMAGLGNGQSAIAVRQSELAQAADDPLPTAGCRPTLPRHLHRAILRLLRPAESAVRRLIIVVARGLVVTLAPPRPRKAKPSPTILRNGVGTGILMPTDARVSGSPSPLRGGVRGGGRAVGTPCLALFDPLRPFRPRSKRQVANGIPRISLPGLTALSAIAPRRPPAPDDALDVTRLALRLAALGAALDDLRGQARRFARWRARKEACRDAAGAQIKKHRTRRVWPLRPGRPPGQRPTGRPAHEVHEILHDLHGLAFDVLECPDTS